jgi:hypothetical protein
LLSARISRRCGAERRFRRARARPPAADGDK